MTLDYEILATEPLRGEMGGVEAMTVLVRQSDGTAEKRRLVRKHVAHGSSEIDVLTRLAEVPLLAGRVPEILDSGEGGRGRWYVMPFYEGVNPPFRSSPEQVFETLAIVHATFEGTGPGSASTLDAAWWHHLCCVHDGDVCDSIAASQPAKTGAAGRIKQALCRWAQDPRVLDALDILPTTLVHRDMHDGNVLVHGSTTTIVDWTTAAWGPALTDLPNLTDRQGAGFEAYARTYERVTGRRRNQRLDDVGWAWGELQVVAAYIGYILSVHTAEAALQWLEGGEQALTRLGIAALDFRGQAHPRWSG